jgi:hypothetical protein
MLESDQSYRGGFRRYPVWLILIKIEHCRVKDRALPHIGRDAVKIGGPDGVTSCRG